MNLKPLLFLAGMLFFLFACESEVEIKTDKVGAVIVVEGSIETDAPPLVVLTRDIPVFAETTPGYAELIISDATVKIDDGTQVYTLDKFCLSDLPDSLKAQFIDFIASTPDPEALENYCIYTSVQFTGKEGKTYKLSVETEEDYVEAVTTIPYAVSIDSIWSKPHKVYGDSLEVLWVILNDPPVLGNRYRYFTSTNGSPFYTGLFNSVFDDRFINGEDIPLNIDKGIPRNLSRDSISFETYGLYRKGDTAIVKISSIDRPHYDFWMTMEQQLNTGGPFSSPTFIKSNIEGGLGVWGGYGPSTAKFVIPK